MTTRIVSVSSSRADVGILSPVWRALAEMPGIDLHLLLTGMHRKSGAPDVAVPSGVTVHDGGADLAGRDGAEASFAMAAIAHDAAALYATSRPDVVMVVGDRLDMLPAATATLAFNIPMLHLHGGELTYGAVDERIRHALTKLSHVHAVSTVVAAGRVVQMGEEPWRVHVVGAPGLDSLRMANRLARDAFAAEVGFDDVTGLRLVTVHPEINAADPLAPLTATLAALDREPAPTLFTAPNSDPGGSEARQRIEAFVAERPWAVFRDTLGPLYASALFHAAVMVGNSSSGLIEAGLFGLPVVNVGGRQDGRERGSNVIDCPAEADAVAVALKAVSTRTSRLAAETPYGDGCSGTRIAALLGNLPPRDVLLAKRFHSGDAEFSAPWACHEKVLDARAR
ncbi:MAG: UDP-N-acetylglucosamine 2-epimerase (hydrolyzing) [Rhodospirillaceae bacterium]|nr:UDP-N-acetylglucosamine 2-epimerase (hydrolyzing) [Rhodospirillaceae bacterium]